MILLRQDCLVFKTAGGETIPCSAQEVTVELMAESLEFIDPELVKNAAQAVLHYFKAELGRTTVSVGEFSQALEKVLRGLGFTVNNGGAAAPATAPLPQVIESNLCELAGQNGEEGELFFFPRLREELQRQLDRSPRVVRFSGLQRCVKQLTGAKRWSGRCQNLNDQIVEYLRTCLTAEKQGRRCALVIS